LLAERNSLAAIHRVKGVKEETVMAWLRIAAAHVERIEALLLANYKLSRAQLDAMWVLKVKYICRQRSSNLPVSASRFRW
jgi:hypothetical protein